MYLYGPSDITVCPLFICIRTTPEKYLFVMTAQSVINNPIIKIIKAIILIIGILILVKLNLLSIPEIIIINIGPILPTISAYIRSLFLLSPFIFARSLINSGSSINASILVFIN